MIEYPYYSKKTEAMQVDHFKEEIIVRKRRGLFNLLLTLITLSMAGAGLMAAIYLVRIQGTLLTPSFSVWDIVIFLVFALIVVGLHQRRAGCRQGRQQHQAQASADGGYAEDRKNGAGGRRKLRRL